MDVTNENMNPPYGQPAVVPVPVPAPPTTNVLVNQQGPANQVAPENYKCVPISTVCLFCKRTMTTKVSKTLNICACLLCYCTGIIFYVAVQACRHKDLCCWDAEHRCPFCGNVVGNYNSC